jgi:hypothetical protein
MQASSKEWGMKRRTIAERLDQLPPEVSNYVKARIAQIVNGGGADAEVARTLVQMIATNGRLVRGEN